jgi:OTU domain-containing protein 3
MKPKLKNLKGFGSKKSSGGAASNSSNSSYLAEDDNFKSFSTQLERLGLQLRDITGDGNCCFRALSDQMFGNESQHLDFRKRVCQYLRQNRDEFEPFVAALIDDEDEDNDQQNGTGANNNKPKRPSFLSSNKKLDAFEKYIKNLEQPGTYADNGCLVAFARLYQVNINIHQLNMPIWTISGLDNNNNDNTKKAANSQPIRELHLSYHNGEHYSSIRSLGDNTKTPTNINFYQDSIPQASSKSSNKNGSRASSAAASSSNSVASNHQNKKSFSYSESRKGDYYEKDELSYADSSEQFEIQIEQIIDITKCLDIPLIKEYLVRNNYDTESTINMLLSSMNLMSLGLEMNDALAEDDANEIMKRPQEKKDKKAEKKERQMERQRIKVLEQHEKEMLAQQKQQSQTAAAAAKNHASNGCSSNNCGCHATASNGIPACANSNSSLDFNVSISNIETKTI